MRKQIFTTIIGVLSMTAANAQQKIKDGTVTGTSLLPNSAAILELESSNKGLLLPRVNLTATTSWGLTGTAAYGMTVYDTSAVTTGSTAYPALTGGKGVYYWNGSGWVGVGNGSGQFWNLKGNRGTTSGSNPVGAAADGNYLGSADSSNLVFGVNGTKRMILDTAGNLVFGGANYDSSTYSLIGGYQSYINTHSPYSVVMGWQDSLITGANWSGGSAIFGDINVVSAKYAGLVFMAGSNHVISGDGYAAGGSIFGQGNAIIVNGSSADAQQSFIAGLQDTIATPLNGGAGRAVVFGLFNKDSASIAFMAGQSNTIGSNGYGSAVVGLSNSIASQFSFIGGRNNMISSNSDNNVIFGQNNTTGAGSQNNALFGQGNTKSFYANPYSPGYGAPGGSLVAGISNIDSGNYNMVSGQENTVCPNCTWNIVGGLSNHAAGIPDPGDVYEQATMAMIFGYGNYCSGKYDFMSGDRNGLDALSNNATILTGEHDSLYNAPFAVMSGQNNIGRGSRFALIAGQSNRDSAGYTFISGANNVIRNNANYSAIIGQGLTATAQQTLYTNNIVVANTLTVNGVGITSDRRFKSNFKPLGYGLSTVMKMQPQEYDQLNAYRVENGKPVTTDKGYEGSHHSFGFVAQDLYNLVPEAVSKPADDSKEHWSVDYAKLVPVLTKAIQEQQSVIKEQEQRIAELEKKEAAYEELAAQVRELRQVAGLRKEKGSKVAKK